MNMPANSSGALTTTAQHCPSTGSQIPGNPFPAVKRQPTTAIQLDPIKLQDPNLCINELNRQYAVVKIGGRAQIADEGGDNIEYLSFHDFERLYSNAFVQAGNQVVSLGRQWIKHANRRQYLNGVVFDPSDQAPPGKLNLWSGYAVDPDSNESCSQILDHLLNVICSGNQQHYDYLLNWLALLVQRPWQLPLVAIVLLSEPGTGKGIFLEYLQKIFGRHFKKIINQSHLVGNFSGHLQDAVLVFADEQAWDGNKANAAILKGLITEPTRMMEKKFADAVQINNCVHLIIASNEKWVVPTEISDRRYFVLDVSASKMGNDAYFDALLAEKNGGGPSGLLAFLLQRDISSFRSSNFPITEARVNQQLQSLEPVEQWLVEQLQLGCIRTVFSSAASSWPEVMEKDTVYDSFCAWFRNGVPKGHRPTLRALTSVLKKYGITSRRMSLPGRPYGYHFPPIELVRQNFESKIRSTIDWEGADA